MTLGERIRQLRVISKLSQEELGKRIGVQRAAIQKYEKGTVENIPLKQIEKIAMVLNVSPTYLVGWSEVDVSHLSGQTKILAGLQTLYGEGVIELLHTYVGLSEEGKTKLEDYANDLSKIYK